MQCPQSGPGLSTALLGTVACLCPLLFGVATLSVVEEPWRIYLMMDVLVVFVSYRPESFSLFFMWTLLRWDSLRSHKACRILAPWPGISLAPLALEGRVLTTGLPRKAWVFNKFYSASPRCWQHSFKEAHGVILWQALPSHSAFLTHHLFQLQLVF